METANRVVLITGAASGIGRAAARLFAAQNDYIAALDHREAPLKDLVEEIHASGGEILPLVADITDATEIGHSMEKIIKEYGHLDVVCANAGINGVWAPLEDLSLDDWNRTLDTNLRGTFLTIKYGLPFLKVQKGVIVVTSSITGTRCFGNIGATIYAVSKAGQIALVKMLAVELAYFGVRVNVVCPGLTATEIEKTTLRRNLGTVPGLPIPSGVRIPLTEGVAARPEQVAQVIFFLASDAASHITGTEIYVDGAQSLICS